MNPGQRHCFIVGIKFKYHLCALFRNWKLFKLLMNYNYSYISIPDPNHTHSCWIQTGCEPWWKHISSMVLEKENANKKHSISPCLEIFMFSNKVKLAAGRNIDTSPIPHSLHSNCPLNEFHFGKLIWRKFFPCQKIHVYSISIRINTTILIFISLETYILILDFRSTYWRIIVNYMVNREKKGLISH